VPVALDLPRWRREQAQVQAAEQVQADVRRARGPGWWNRPDKSTSAASVPSGAPEPIEPKGQSPVLAWREIPFETVDDAEGTGGLDTEEQIRARRGATWNRMFPGPLTESDRRFWTARDSGYSGPLNQDGQPGDPDQWPEVWRNPAQTGRDVSGGYDGSAPVPTRRGRPRPPERVTCRWWSHDHGRCPRAPHPGSEDGLCDLHHHRRYGVTPTDLPAGTSPDGITTPTEGDPVPYTGIDELDNLTSVKDMAKLVADMAEESDFAQLVEFCKNASDETRDFGSDMAGDVAEFEEIATKIGDLLAELADAAQKVDSRADELTGG
jgi:hypothetical protein